MPAMLAKPPPPKLCRVRTSLAYFAILGVWLPLVALWWISGGAPEHTLIALFGQYSRVDAFEFIDRVAGIFCVVHTSLCVAAGFAVYYRRFDVFLIFWIGPALALGFYVVGSGISDPAWYTIAALGAIGEMVSLVVAIGYWIANRRGAGNSTSSSDSPPAAGSDSNG
jgi:hypothetical protein